MENNKSILKAAICQFKAKVGKITKDKDNPFFKSKYADLAIILEVIDEDLSECGLVLNSYTLYNEGVLQVKTDLSHKDSSEVISSVFPVFGNKPQEIGSSITYARRYNIQSLLNLAAEDDDGNSANNAKPIKGAMGATDGTPQAAGFKNAAEGKKHFTSALANMKAIDTIEKLSQKKIGIQEYIERLAKWDAQIAEDFRKQFEEKRKEIGDFIDDEVPDFINN